MSVDELQDRIAEVLRGVVPSAPQSMDPATPFRDQFEMDSLDFLNFVLALEKEFEVKVPEVRYPRCASLTGAAAVIEECR